MSMTKVEIYKYLLDNVNSEIEARVQKLKFIYAIDIVFVAFLCSVYTRQDVKSKINLSSETHFIAFFFYMPFIFFSYHLLPFCSHVIVYFFVIISSYV